MSDGYTATVNHGWGPGGEHVLAALKGLTRAERKRVAAGYIDGDATMPTIRSLRCKAMFYLKITSPNGRCGHYELTPLGESVRATIKAKATAQSGEA